MKKFVLSSALALSLCAVGAFAENMTGYISDAHCGAKHHEVSEKNTACVKTCLKGGADPVLVSNGKVYKLDDAAKDKAKEYAGQNVTVSGTVDGDTVHVDSMTPASSGQ